MGVHARVRDVTRASEGCRVKANCKVAAVRCRLAAMGCRVQGLHEGCRVKVSCRVAAMGCREMDIVCRDNIPGGAGSQVVKVSPIVGVHV